MEFDRYADARFGRPIRTPGLHGYVTYLPQPIPRSLTISTENIALLGDTEAALGRFRTTQNWIGSGAATLETATFVPPPPDEVGALIDDFELFIHQPTELPLLVKTALLRAIGEQSNDAVVRAERLLDIRERYRSEVQSETRGSANQVVDLIFESPVLTTRVVEAQLGISRPRANTALKQLASLGILGRLADAGDRGQLVWQAPEVLAVLTDQDPAALEVRTLSQ